MIHLDHAGPGPTGGAPELPTWLLDWMGRALAERRPFRDARAPAATPAPRNLASVTTQLVLHPSVEVTGDDALTVTFVSPVAGVYRATMGKVEQRAAARAGERLTTASGVNAPILVRLDGADGRVRIQHGPDAAPEAGRVHPGLTPVQAALRHAGTRYVAWWPAGDR